jgi:hypothetical protein
MFVLMYEAAYEGQTVLGVYSSLDIAKKAVQEVGARWDLVIREFLLDGAPDFALGALVWSYVGEDD